MSGPPFERLGTTEVAAVGRLRLRTDRLRWPGGEEAEYNVLEQADAVIVVALEEDGSTHVVRQWRHAWNGESWELPAGTVEPGEAADVAAARELAEEAGLSARTWISLGTVRATALSAMVFHLYLARDLAPVPRAPEIYEQDMTVDRLPFGEVMAMAINGRIQHAATIAALVRAAAHHSEELQDGGR